jgi:hypothetical protein
MSRVHRSLLPLVTAGAVLALAGPAGAIAATAPTINPSSWNAGAVPPGQGPVVQTFTLASPGDAAVTISSFDVAGQSFSLVGSSCVRGQVIPPGSSCSITVGFSPAGPADAVGALEVGYDPSGASPLLEITLYGTGSTDSSTAPLPVTAPPAPVAVVPVTGTTIVTPVTPATAPAAQAAGTASVRLSTPKTLRPSTKGSVALGRAACSGAGGCTLTVAATVRANGRTFRLSRVQKVAVGKSDALAVVLGKSPLQAVRKAKHARISVVVTGGPSTIRHSWTIAPRR